MMAVEGRGADSVGWRITIGVNAGYGEETKEPMAEEELVGIYRRAAEAVEAASGVYVTGVLWPTRTIYKTEWGCPEGGEFTYTFSGSCNPTYTETEAYRGALLQLAERLKQELQQTTVLLELFPAEVYYLKG